ncbi:RER1B-like protein [Ochromonadaceae sp. CCMP2298]|nr:RER1B-like protein [Ochromonadaceae sp. CCMP2298]
MEAEEAAPASAVASFSRKFQYVMDKSSPMVLYRWLAFSGIFGLYLLRVYMLNGMFIVTYGLGIYLLNQLIGFLSPQFDPEESDSDFSLPTSNNEEFRPFARRLPEFKFWYQCGKAVLISLCMTFFSFFDIPVFWPILLLYFIVLFFITMKRQIKHMIKYRYVPFSFGKTTYAGGGGKARKDSK